jgi:hypothetical protein
VERAEIVGNHHFWGLSMPEMKIINVFAGVERLLGGEGINVQLSRTGGCRFRGMRRDSIFMFN